MALLRRTTAICSKCFNKIPADIIESDDSIFMVKRCKEHTEQDVLISKEAYYYKELSDFYFSLNLKNTEKAGLYYNFHMNSRCNLKCTNCPGTELKEPSIDFIEKKLKNLKDKKIGIWGSEMTERNDLPKIIGLIRRSGNIPVLYTNGIKLADMKYLRLLKRSGLTAVYLRFEGFDGSIYRRLYGENLLSAKLTALKNLEKLNISTSIRTVVKKGINDNELAKILEYCIKKPHIKCLMFQTSYFNCIDQKNNDETSNRRMTIEEIIRILEDQTNKRISNEKVLYAQKAIYSLFDIVRLKKAFCNRDIPIIRKKSLDDSSIFYELIDFKGMDDILKRYAKIKNRKRAKAYLIFSLCLRAFNVKLIPLSYLFLKIAIFRIFTRKRTLLSDIGSSVFLLSFIDPCTIDNFDFDATKGCPLGEISQDYGTQDSLAISSLLKEMRRKKK